MTFSLRPYQLRALEEDAKLRASGARVVALVSPTGSGKTAMAVEWARRRGGRGVFVAHRDELLDQARKTLARAHVNAEVVSIQSQLGGLPRGDWFALDEAHHYISAPKWSEAIAVSRAGPTIALTATPERSDGAALGNLADGIVTVAQPRELIADGFLTPCDVLAGERQTKHLTDHPWDSYRKHANGRKTIVFCPNVAYALECAQEFRERGISAACVHGEMHWRERSAAFEAHREGRIRVLCSVNLVIEGYDDPTVTCAIMARRFGSAGGWIQACGRIVRTSPGKTRALVIDLHGSVWAWGLPDADRHYSLDGEAIHIGEDTGAATRQCKTCFRIFPSSAFLNGQCPACGASEERETSPIVVVEEIARVTFEQLNTEQLEWLSKARQYATQHSYKPGWVSYKFRDKFGAWPPGDLGKSPEEVRAEPESERRAFYQKMVAIGQAKGYKPAFAKVRFRQRYNQWPPAGW